jgi:hypothetical protein
VDAKAEAGEVAIGGWAPFVGSDGKVDTYRSRWFAVALHERSAPWAYVRGEPYRAISALELFGTVLGMILFDVNSGVGTSGRGAVEVTGLTDSKVASLVVGRELTTSYPLCLLAMEASAQMEARGLSLRLHWIPRGSNQEADDLSNFRFAGFDPALRVPVDLKTMDFLVLSRLQSESDEFYRQVEWSKKHQTKAPDPPWSKKRKEGLRVTDPW